MIQRTELRVRYTWTESLPPISPQVWDMLWDSHMTKEPVEIVGHAGRYVIEACEMGTGFLSFTAIKEVQR